MPGSLPAGRPVRPSFRFIVALRVAAANTRRGGRVATALYQPEVPGPPFTGPTISGVTQPP